MKSQVFSLFLLLAPAAALNEATPVEKVVNLLKDLKAKSVADGEGEDKVYNAYACWCETTTKKKAADINKASADIRALGQQILKFKGKVATLDGEIQDLDASLEQNAEQQQAATALRTKRNGVYQSMAAETKETLGGLNTAIDTLRAATSLVQTDAKAQAMSAVQSVLDKLPERAEINNDHLVFLSEFMAHGGSYAPQGATIQGILSEMYAEFAANLEKATMAEAGQNKNYETIISIAETAATDLTKIKNEKEVAKSEAEEDLAATTATYDSTSDEKKANIEFFDEAKKGCEEKHAEYEARTAARTSEAAGIDKALELLTSDAARQLFADAIKPGVSTSFLQIASDNSQSVSFKVYSVLKEQATKAKSIRMAMIAVQARTAKAGHFDVVMKSIDGMVGTLNTEAEADKAKKDECTTNYQEIAQDQGDINWKIEKNEAKIAKLESTIELRTQDKADAISQKTDSETFRGKLKADRTAEHGAFKTAQSNDRAAIKLLQTAEAALAAFYTTNNIEMGKFEGSLIQEKQAPDARLSSADDNKQQSKGIMSLLKYITQDLESELVTDQKIEEKSQVAYEEAIATATALEDDLDTKISDLGTIISTKGGKKGEEVKALSKNEGNLKTSTDYEAKITPDCDWVKKNFAGRAQARQAEMDGLTSAKAMLAGQGDTSGALLQVKAPAASKDKLANIRFLGMH